MTSSPHGNCRLAKSSLREPGKCSEANRRDHRWWQCAFLSIGYMTGCATWDQVGHTAAQPFRATSEFMARTGDQIGDFFEWNSSRHRTPANVPSHQAINHAVAKQSAPAQSGVKPAAAQAESPSISKPAASQAIHNSPGVPEKPRESLSVPSAPPAVELLAPPPDSASSATMPTGNGSKAAAAPIAVQQVSSSKPIAQAKSDSTMANLANMTWCRVRIRNIGQQAAPQVAVTVASPGNASLVSKEGETVSAPTTGKMEFAPVAQVSPNEEVILIVGVAAADERANRLRVQVRDALGGSNQDVQSRWQVAIEAMQ